MFYLMSLRVSYVPLKLRHYNSLFSEMLALITQLTQIVHIPVLCKSFSQNKKD